MNRPRIIALFALTICAAGLLGLLWPRQREPVYQGKPLSAWVISLGLAGNETAPAEDQKDAILQIGTNGLPFLIKWITAPPPRYLRIFDTPVAIPFEYTKAELAQGSLVAFDIMGPCAAPALPDLVRLVTETNEIIFSRVFDAIDAVVRNLGTNGALAVPPLVQLLNGPDSEVAGMAAHQLVKIGKRTQTDAIVAALARATESTDSYVRYSAALGLGDLGPSAESAVPALVRALDDSDVEVRGVAINSLNKVSPQIFCTKEAEHTL